MRYGKKTCTATENRQKAAKERYSAGFSFTTEGKYTENSYGIKIQGIEKSGYVPESPDAPAPVEEKDEGMALTDILLIVLVILAAILVVVVAIRMMRS